jgi:hypothetical protein
VELIAYCTEVLEYLNANKQYSTLAAIYQERYMTRQVVNAVCYNLALIRNFPDFCTRIKAKHFHQYVASSCDDTANIENVSNIRGVL